MSKSLLRIAASFAVLLFAATDAAAAFRLGVSATLSGANAVNGQSTVNGLNLALEAINAAGGVGGQPIELVIVDDKGTPVGAQAAFDKLIQTEKVLMVFGPTLTPQAEQAWVFSNASGVVAFGTSLTSSHLTRLGPYTFRNAVTEDIMTPQSVRLAVAKLKVKRMAAIFQDDDAFAQGAFFAAHPAMLKAGGTLVAREAFTKDNKEFADRVARMKAKNPDVLYVSCRANDAAAIIVEARKQGLNVPVIGNNNFVSKALYDAAKGAANNVIFTIPWSADDDSPKNVQFIGQYESKYKVKANHFAALAFDALYVVAEALKKVPPGADVAAGRQALYAALPDVRHEGATGKMKFVRNKGAGYNAEKDVFTHVYRDGKFEYWKAGMFGLGIGWF